MKLREILTALIVTAALGVMAPAPSAAQSPCSYCDLEICACGLTTGAGGTTCHWEAPPWCCHVHGECNPSRSNVTPTGSLAAAFEISAPAAVEQDGGVRYTLGCREYVIARHYSPDVALLRRAATDAITL